MYGQQMYPQGAQFAPQGAFGQQLGGILGGIGGGYLGQQGLGQRKDARRGGHQTILYCRTRKKQ